MQNVMFLIHNIAFMLLRLLAPPFATNYWKSLWVHTQNLTFLKSWKTEETNFPKIKGTAWLHVHHVAWANPSGVFNFESSKNLWQLEQLGAIKVAAEASWDEVIIMGARGEQRILGARMLSHIWTITLSVVRITKVNFVIVKLVDD